MTHLETELQQVKNDVLIMWELVISQLRKSMKTLVTSDLELVKEISLSEKIVNTYELKIDRDCENIFALYNPVAVDLRFVLAVLKINSNLERIGDFASGIAKFARISNVPFEVDLLMKTRTVEMFEEACDIVEDVMLAFKNEDAEMANRIFVRDEMLDEINKGAVDILSDIIRKNPEKTEQCLFILSCIRKIERVGDQSKNIAEEIIFYLEAKVLKHNKNKGKI